MKRIAIEDFGSLYRDRFLDVGKGSPVKLAPSWLLTNESGVNGDVPEELSAAEHSRVEFDLPSARVKGAEVLFYVKGDTSTQDRPLRLVVNGHRLSHRQRPEKMLTGGWDRARIPARCLQDGVNEFTFSHSGVLHVDPGAGGRSSRSFDGGETWHRNALGPAGDVQGEYLVRLRLKGFAPRGQLTGKVVDLADPSGEGLIAPRLEVNEVRLKARTRAPRGTGVQFEMRSGSTPAFAPRTWSPWQEGSVLTQPGRFVQWRATLTTDRADRTPVLSRVTLEADLREDKASLRGLELLELDQPEIARSSYLFTYLGPHRRADRLRQQYRLDRVIAAGQTELEQLALLRDWVHSQWLGWQADKYPYCPPWDALEILEATKGSWGFGMCTHYGATFAACAASLGWVARVLVVDHHCLAEVWCEELQKWILQDAGPNREYDATYERRGVPVNALEFHRALVAGQAHHLTINKLPQKTTARMTRNWGKLFVRFGIPLRNNHLVQAEPAELDHGYSQYHWDGYLWWSDTIDPKHAEYSLQTGRPEDFYWSVNQTRLYPQAAAEPGVLEVQVETVTPNLSHLLVQVDDGEWERAGGAADLVAARGRERPGRAQRQRLRPDGAHRPGPRLHEGVSGRPGDAAIRPAPPPGTSRAPAGPRRRGRATSTWRTGAPCSGR